MAGFCIRAQVCVSCLCTFCVAVPLQCPGATSPPSSRGTARAKGQQEERGAVFIRSPRPLEGRSSLRKVFFGSGVLCRGECRLPGGLGDRASAAGRASLSICGGHGWGQRRGPALPSCVGVLSSGFCLWLPLLGSLESSSVGLSLSRRRPQPSTASPWLAFPKGRMAALPLLRAHSPTPAPLPLRPQPRCPLARCPGRPSPALLPTCLACPVHVGAVPRFQTYPWACITHIRFFPGRCCRQGTLSFVPHALS